MFRWHRRCGDLSTPAELGEPAGERVLVTTAETVPVAMITGTVSRCCDFDRCFRPLRPDLVERLRSLQRHLRGRHVPAIRLFRVDDHYFVVDGHHRLAVARERAMVAIDAIVTCRCPIDAS